MSTKFKLAIEQMEQQEAQLQMEEPTITESEAELEMTDLAVDSDVQEIDTTTGEIENAETVSEAVQDISDTFQASVDAEQGVTEEAAKVTEIAVEQYRVAYGFKKPLSLGTEDFKVVDNRLAKTKLAIENLQQFKGQLDKGIVIAQEGLIDRIKNAFERGRSNDEKLLKQLDEISAKFDQATELKTEVIVDPAWGRVFARSGKKQIESNDVVELINKVKKISRKDAPVIINKLIKVFEDARAALNKGTFFADKEGVSKLKELIKEVETISKELADIFLTQEFDPKQSEGKVNVTPITKGNKTKLINTAKDLLKDKTFETLMDRLEVLSDDLESDYQKNRVTKLAGILTRDMSLVFHLSWKAERDICDALFQLQVAEYKLCFGAYKYTQASIKK